VFASSNLNAGFSEHAVRKLSFWPADKYT